jgi:hypothetical protein
MTTFEAHFTGLQDFRDAAQKVDQRLARAVCKDAHRRASVVVTTAVRSLARKDSGLMASAVQSKTRLNADGTSVYSLIGISRKVVDIVAAQMRVRFPKGQLAVAGGVERLHLGNVAQNNIAAATSIAGARRRKPSKYYFNVEHGHGGKHGPAAAYPFIEPGWEMVKQEVLQIMQTYARSAVVPGGMGGIGDVGGEAAGDQQSAVTEQLREKAVQQLNRAVGFKRRTGRDRKEVLKTWAKNTAADRRAVKKTWAKARYVKGHKQAAADYDAAHPELAGYRADYARKHGGGPGRDQAGRFTKAT